MTEILKNLYDKKGKIVNEMKDTLHKVEGREDKLATKEEREKFTKWEAEQVELDEQIKFHSNAAKLADIQEARGAVELESEMNPEKEFNNKATGAERRSALAKAKRGETLSKEDRVIVDTDVRDTKVFERYLRSGYGELSKEDKAVMGLYRGSEQRIQNVTTTTAGGFTVPEGFSGRIIEHMAFISDLLNHVSFLDTETGNDIPHPINDDTSNTGELVSESGDYSSSAADLVFSNYTLGAYKLSSKLIKVSEELLQDNGVNLVDYMAKQMANRVARIANTYYTTGSGSAEPKGYIFSAGRGTVTASTSTWTLAELQALADSLDPAYQQGAVFSAHQNLISELKQLALATDKFGSVWAPSFRDGEPDRILGKGYFMNQAMSSTSATGDKIWAFGDMSKYIVRRVNGFSMRRLDERYAENGQVAFFGVQRTDGFLSDTSSVKYMDIS